MKVSFSEVLEHAHGVDTRFGAGDRNEAVAAVHRLHDTRLRDAVIDAVRTLLLLLLSQQTALSAAAARLHVSVRVSVRVCVEVGHQVLARLRVQSVAELS